MKILHILKSEPDVNTKAFMKILSDEKEPIVFPLYVTDVDYERLIDLIFEYDTVITWW